jgi:hypothetical protein
MSLSRETAATVFTERAAFEPHYRIGELARMWKLGQKTIRQLQI